MVTNIDVNQKHGQQNTRKEEQVLVIHLILAVQNRFIEIIVTDETQNRNMSEFVKLLHRECCPEVAQRRHDEEVYGGSGTKDDPYICKKFSYVLDAPSLPYKHPIYRPAWFTNSEGTETRGEEISLDLEWLKHGCWYKSVSDDYMFIVDEFGFVHNSENEPATISMEGEAKYTHGLINEGGWLMGVRHHKRWRDIHCYVNGVLYSNQRAFEEALREFEETVPPGSDIERVDVWEPITIKSANKS